MSAICEARRTANSGETFDLPRKLKLPITAAWTVAQWACSDLKVRCAMGRTIGQSVRLVKDYLSDRHVIKSPVRPGLGVDYKG
jgi:hypothetical protein